MDFGEQEDIMKGNFFKQLIKKIIKSIICIGMLYHRWDIIDFITKIHPALFAVIPIVLFVIGFALFEAVTNIFGYLMKALREGVNCTVNDWLTINFTFILDALGGSPSNGDMFRPDGSLTFRGKNAVNDICHQRDMYNRTSTHRYLDKK